MVLDFLAEGVCEPGERAHGHPHRQVLALDAVAAPRFSWPASLAKVAGMLDALQPTVTHRVTGAQIERWAEATALTLAECTRTDGVLAVLA